MPTTEVTVPDKLDSDITHLVEQGEFLNREQAIEELMSLGISAYDTSEPAADELTEEVFTQAMEEQHDPAMDADQSGDEHTF